MKPLVLMKRILLLGVIGLLPLMVACGANDATHDDMGTNAQDSAAAASSTGLQAAVEAEAEPEVSAAALDAAREACAPEIEAYCSQVTPGGGRLLACFAAHEDKLSGTCSAALFGASTSLEAFTRATAYTMTVCYEDLVEHCSDVEAGVGLVAECLLSHQAELSPDCLEVTRVAE